MFLGWLDWFFSYLEEKFDLGGFGVLPGVQQLFVEDENVLECLRGGVDPADQVPDQSTLDFILEEEEGLSSGKVVVGVGNGAVFGEADL